jgi:DNA-binding PadR family transcriptional regulator
MFASHYGRHGCEGRWAAGRWGRGRHGFRSGGEGRHGMGGGVPRLGRFVGSGDLQLIALSLIAERPRHGYEIIKVLEEKTSGAYSPSPGMVYPTLTFLEEADYVTAQADGAKKLYTITELGAAHLATNRDYVDALLERLAAAGAKIASIRRQYEEANRDERTTLSPLVRAALDKVGEAAAKRLESDPNADTRIVEMLIGLADQLRKQ